MSQPTGRRSAKADAPEQLSRGETTALVMLLAGALVATAILVSWIAEQRGIIAPGSSVLPIHDDDPEAYDDGTEPGAPDEL